MAYSPGFRRRSMVGAPPSKPGPSKSFNRHLKIEEESNEDSTSSTEDEVSNIDNNVREVGTDRKKRRKRRIRLTDYGSKAKRRIERREKAMEKVEVEQTEEESPQNESDEEPETKVSLSELSPFQLFCDSLLKRFIAKDPEEFFSQPVLPSVAPDYFNVIDIPMDFSTMQKKIEQNAYSHIDDFRRDVNLISENAMTYNKPNTVYYLAAQKHQHIAKHYLSDVYLEFLRYSLPFGAEIPHELLGLRPKHISRPIVAPVPKDLKANSMKAALNDQTDTKTVLRQTNSNLRAKLTEKKPTWHLGYMDKKAEGPIALNILTGAEKSSITMGDLIGRLEQGTPYLIDFDNCDEPKSGPISYTNYGAFDSFAPQFDSTWASLNKSDSDLLISCYGDKNNVTDVLAIRQMVTNSGSEFMKIIDDVFDNLTDGEHRRTIDALEKKKASKGETTETEIEHLLEDIGTLSNVGLDTQFLSDVRKSLGLPDPNLSADLMLKRTGSMVADLNALQRKRLGGDTIGESLRSSTTENALAGNLVRELTNEVSEFGVSPNVMASTNALHQAIGINDDECDYDLLAEFMVV